MTLIGYFRKVHW